LDASPSLRREIDAAVKKQAPRAAKLAAAGLKEYGEHVETVWVRLQKGGFTPNKSSRTGFPASRLTPDDTLPYRNRALDQAGVAIGIEPVV
jgi:hypothetical protein